MERSVRREMAGQAETAPADLADRMRRGFAWWVDELRALVPNRLLARSSQRPAAIDCVLHDDGAIAFALATPGILPAAGDAVPPEQAAMPLAALARAAPRPTVRLCVPRALCLSRRSVLPARALVHAGAILRHEIETLTPLEPADILSDWYVETEDPQAGELHLVQIALARPRIRAVEDALAEAGLALTHLTVGDAEGRPVPVDLVGRRDPSLRATLAGLPRAAQIMLAAAALLVAWAPFGAAGNVDAATGALMDERAAAPKASPASLSASAVADFLDARSARRPLAVLLDEVARRLPPGASLSGIGYAGDTLTIRLGGPSEGARAAFSASPVFASATEGPEPGTLVLAIAPPAADGEGRP